LPRRRPLPPIWRAPHESALGAYRAELATARRCCLLLDSARQPVEAFVQLQHCGIPSPAHVIDGLLLLTLGGVIGKIIIEAYLILSVRSLLILSACPALVLVEPD
jgi:hypothetical protein